MTLQKLIDLGYEAFPHSPYSPNLSLINYYFSSIWTLFFNAKKHYSKGEVETVFKDFLASKPLEFYLRGIVNEGAIPLVWYGHLRVGYTLPLYTDQSHT